MSPIENCGARKIDDPNPRWWGRRAEASVVRSRTARRAIPTMDKPVPGKQGRSAPPPLAACDYDGLIFESHPASGGRSLLAAFLRGGDPTPSRCRTARRAIPTGAGGAAAPGGGTSPQVPDFWRGNFFFSALAGTTWYFQFFFYTMGETQMGTFGFASWTLHMASIGFSLNPYHSFRVIRGPLLLFLG